MVFEKVSFGWSRSHIGSHCTDFAVRKSYMFPNDSPQFLSFFFLFALAGLVPRKLIFKEPLNAQFRTTLK